MTKIPSAASSSASNGWSSTPKAWRPTSRSPTRPAIGKSLVDRLADNERVLLGAYRSIAKAADEGRPITPAAEWLLDNYHLVEQQVREVRTDLPPGYYRQLPKLSSGPLAGYPARVRHGLGLRRPHRQPLRSGDADPLRARLPDGPAAHHRRAVGRGDHAAHRAGREPAALGRAHHEPPVGARGSRRRGRPAAGRERPAWPTRPRSRPTHQAPFSEGFVVQLVQRLRDQDPEAIARGRLARGAAEARRARLPTRLVRQRASAAGRDQRHGAQHHHQHAPDLRRRLGEAVRER